MATRRGLLKGMAALLLAMNMPVPKVAPRAEAMPYAMVTCWARLPGRGGWEIFRYAITEREFCDALEGGELNLGWFPAGARLADIRLDITEPGPKVPTLLDVAVNGRLPS